MVCFQFPEREVKGAVSQTWGSCEAGLTGQRCDGGMRWPGPYLLEPSSV